MGPSRLSIEDDVDPQGAAAIRRLVERGICKSCDYLARVDSTNTRALSQLSDTDPSNDLPRIYLADQQTAGRGRHGRSWQSSSRTLTFSLVVNNGLQEASHRALVPIAAGVGIANYLEFEFAPVQTQLKWPNDVYAGGGKVAGILMETSAATPNRLVVGIGLNVGDAPNLDSSGSASPAKSLSQILGRSVDRYAILVELVCQVMNSIKACASEAEAILEGYQQRCLLTGNQIDFAERGEKRRGVCQGIGPDGSLLVDVDGETKRLNSGEANLVRSSSGLPR